jgi:hypothetical protein
LQFPLKIRRQSIEAIVWLLRALNDVTVIPVPWHASIDVDEVVTDYVQEHLHLLLNDEREL